MDKVYYVDCMDGSSQMINLSQLISEQSKIFGSVNVIDVTKVPAYLKCENCEVKGKMRCGKCKTARYCSQNCQKTHWKVHKEKCS